MLTDFEKKNNFEDQFYSVIEPIYREEVLKEGLLVKPYFRMAMEYVQPGYILLGHKDLISPEIIDISLIKLERDVLCQIKEEVPDDVVWKGVKGVKT